MVIKLDINKKGVWRVVEATLAVLAIAIFILLLLSKRPSSEKNDISSSLRSILNEIAKDATLREKILTDTNSNNDAEEAALQVFKDKINNPVFDYNITICGYADFTCGNIDAYPANKEVYSEERLITADLNNYNPKILKIYAWRKN